MIDFTLKELQEFLNAFFERRIARDSNRNSIVAATHCFYEYEPIMKAGVTEKIVCTLIIGKILKDKGNRIFEGQYNLLKAAIEDAYFFEKELDLSNSEKNTLIKMAKELEDNLSKMIIEYGERSE